MTWKTDEVHPNPAIVGLIDRYQRTARERGLIWDLTYNECRKLFSAPCFYCEAPPLRLFVHGGGKLRYNGIDRVDPFGGYTTENAVSCCWDCNRSKANRSLPAWEEWVERVSRCLQERGWSGIGVGRELEKELF